MSGSFGEQDAVGNAYSGKKERSVKPFPNSPKLS